MPDMGVRSPAPPPCAPIRHAGCSARACSSACVPCSALAMAEVAGDEGEEEEVRQNDECDEETLAEGTAALGEGEEDALEPSVAELEESLEQALDLPGSEELFADIAPEASEHAEKAEEQGRQQQEAAAEEAKTEASGPAAAEQQPRRWRSSGRRKQKPQPQQPQMQEHGDAVSLAVCLNTGKKKRKRRLAGEPTEDARQEKERGEKGNPKRKRKVRRTKEGEKDEPEKKLKVRRQEKQGEKEKPEKKLKVRRKEERGGKEKPKQRRKERRIEQSKEREREKKLKVRRTERHEEKEQESRTETRPQKTEGVVPAAEATAEPTMPRTFTVDEHNQRFKSKWHSGHEKALLGKGSYAHVYREYDTQEGTFVAHKIPNAADISMEHEVAILTKFAGQCNNLTQLLGVVVASHDARETPVGILIEYCHQSLHDHWHREMGLIALDVQRRCLGQVLKGLRHLHASGIVHLDLGPKNILFHWNAWCGLRVKIGDFGEAEFLAFGEFLEAREKVTTWPYRAPEVALGLPYNHAADVWAVGVLARELATGRRLYDLSHRDGTDVQYIYALAGPLMNSTWPDVESAPFWEAPPRNFCPDSDQLTRHARVNQDGVCFARRLLLPGPQQRPTAQEALSNGYLAYGQAAVPIRLRRKQRIATPFPAVRPAPARSNAVSLAGDAKANAEHVDGSRRRCACKNTCRQPTHLCGASWGRNPSCQAALSDTEEAALSVVCRSCRCEWCENVRWRSKACHACQWRLAPTAYMAVHQYSTTLAWMIPVDLVGFVSLVSLENPLQAIVLAQLYCPVCVRYVVTYKDAGTSARRVSPRASPRSASSWQNMAAAMATLYKQMSRWREANSPEWQWHERYMSNCHEGGGQLKLGPEAVGKRCGFVQCVPKKKSAKEVIVFTSSGAKYVLDEQGGAETLKKMSEQLHRCKWQPSAPAVSRGASVNSESSSWRDTPGAGRPSVADIMKHFDTICRDVLTVGVALPDLKIGKDSEYIRPHVCRKLFLALLHVSGWTFATFPWKRLSMTDLVALGPDIQGYVSKAPGHWRHKRMEIFLSMDSAAGSKVPIVMHGCWACLFGYALSRTSTVGMGERAVTYIDEGHGEEFERCARALCVRNGVQPTPLKILREIIAKNSRFNDDDVVEWQGPWGEAPALFAAQTPGLPVSFGTPPP